jgi:hypothetical protein
MFGWAQLSHPQDVGGSAKAGASGAVEASARRGASGNIGVNIASGVGNVQFKGW